MIESSTSLPMPTPPSPSIPSRSRRLHHGQRDAGVRKGGCSPSHYGVAHTSGAEGLKVPAMTAISPEVSRSTSAFAGRIAPPISAQSSERLGVGSQYLGMTVTRL